AVRRALVVTTLATAGGIVFAVAWRVIRRRRQRRLVVELSTHPLQGGEQYQVALVLPDPTERHKIQMELVCEEVCDKGNRVILVSQAVAFDEPANPTGARLGRFTVPANAPTSLTMEYHGIFWYLKAGWKERGRWKKLNFPVQVEPAAQV